MTFDQNLCVSRKIIQEKALDLANKKGLTDFKASLTWVQKFMDRNGFTFRRKTTQSQRFLGEKKMKSALDYNPHSIIIRNFWEKKRMKSAGCFRVNWVYR